jgi:hypothetical protein
VYVTDLSDSVGTTSGVSDVLRALASTKDNSPVLALSVHLRIEIAVVKYDRISTSQTIDPSIRPQTERKDALDTDIPRPRRRDEAKDPRIRVKPLGNVLPFLSLGRTVLPEIEIPMEVEKDLQNVQHARHLRENQDPMAPRPPLPQ